MEPVGVPADPPPARPRAVTVIGRTFLVLSTLRVLEDLWGWFVWKLGDAERLVLFFLPRGANALVPVDAVVRNLGTIVAVQGIAAACVALISYNFLRLRPWARTALEAVCWIALAAVGAAILAIIAVSSRVGPSGVSGVTLVIAGAIAVALLLALTIRSLRRPDVRRAFSGVI